MSIVMLNDVSCHDLIQDVAEDLKQRSFKTIIIQIIFFQNIRKELVDGRVLEAHIVPHKLLFTRSRRYIKLFSSPMMLRQNKLECLPLQAF